MTHPPNPRRPPARSVMPELPLTQHEVDMRYRIIQYGSGSGLATLVNAAIAEGWVPLGGVSVLQVIESRSSDRYAQAVTHPNLAPADPIPEVPMTESTGGPLFPAEEDEGGYGHPKEG